MLMLNYIILDKMETSYHLSDSIILVIWKMRYREVNSFEPSQILN